MTYDIHRIRKRLRVGRPLHSGPVQLVHTVEGDQPVTFCVTNSKDAIQKKHWKGEFYEKAELRALAQVFPSGGTFLDIGANIGNHTLYAALIWKAARVVPIEPNPIAYNLLLHNISVNGVRDRVDLSKVGVGLSDHDEGGFAMEKVTTNLGGARMLAGQGALTVHRGDALLAGLEPDMIKIDVEGMEMEALRGLEGLLRDRQPALLVEVHNRLSEDFFAWCDALGYACAATVTRYKNNKNHLMVPAADVQKTQAALQGTALEETVAG
ncbi:MAG: FkbM family methyltransferase [Pseudomonadota bacterium]